MRIIITGATGMVGEGVMMECVQNEAITEVLIVNRRHLDFKHYKLKELIIDDFMKVEQYIDSLQAYDACFFCAGISSIGLNELEYTKITYDLTLQFAKTLAKLNTSMVFVYVSGSLTDSTENGKVMWARVKGKTENELKKLPFRGEYNFRPGFMTPVIGQKNVKWYYKPFFTIFSKLIPSKTLSLNEVGNAMIITVLKDYPKQVLEIEDIKKLAK